MYIVFLMNYSIVGQSGGPKASGHNPSVKLKSNSNFFLLIEGFGELLQSGPRENIGGLWKHLLSQCLQLLLQYTQLYFVYWYVFLIILN